MTMLSKEEEKLLKFIELKYGRCEMMFHEDYIFFMFECKDFTVECCKILSSPDILKGMLKTNKGNVDLTNIFIEEFYKIARIKTLEHPNSSNTKKFNKLVEEIINMEGENK